jgi:glycosyltransferase involved in cell wall biosynthesis
LFAGFAEARSQDPALRLAIAGSRSEEVEIPAGIQDGVDRLGYVTFDGLIREYQSSKALVLLSDYEAFGCPIAEALCCGLPVIINRQPQVVRIFEGLPGVNCVTNSDSREVGDTILRVVAQDPSGPRIAAAAAERFSLQATYGKKLDYVLRLCRKATLPMPSEPLASQGPLAVCVPSEPEAHLRACSTG